jgi:hypothetical protein
MVATRRIGLMSAVQRSVTGTLQRAVVRGAIKLRT